MDNCKLSFKIKGSDSEPRVISWFKGSSYASICKSVRASFDEPALTKNGSSACDLIFRDPRSGCVVALSDNIPNEEGSYFTVEYSNFKTSFREQVLKFENIQAHLANERTWLAWVRTALATLVVAFALLFLADNSSRVWISIGLYVCGIFLVVYVVLTFLIGWQRYQCIAEILFRPKSLLQENFNRFGIRHHARYLSVLLFSICIFVISDHINS